jgi:hypothetical protein
MNLNFPDIYGGLPNKTIEIIMSLNGKDQIL